MRRKLLKGLLCASMAAVMAAGCGSSSGGGTGSDAKDKEEKKDASDGKTTLTFWCHENEPWVKAYKEMAEKFEDANPDYKVEVQDYPFKVYNDKIQTALTSSTAGPDIVAVWGGTAPSFIASDALAEVPEDLVKEFEEDYMAPTLGIYQKEGKYYGVPMEFNLEYGGMIVNKKLFDDAELSYPETWEELRKISKDVSKKNGDIVEMKGFEMM
ncbi:MAG: extracellular solute-binding protein, partial [Dorea sp.]|nr:extracellular solute-binding protein [Dorea sp.]